jgi:spore coat protein U-like protein
MSACRSMVALTLPGALPPGTYADTLTVTLTW